MVGGSERGVARGGVGGGSAWESESQWDKPVGQGRVLLVSVIPDRRIRFSFFLFLFYALS